MHKGSVTCGECVQDFLKVVTASQEYAHVQAVLLDPSCSGSGTALRHLDGAHESDTLPGNAHSGLSGCTRGASKRTRGDCTSAQPSAPAEHCSGETNIERAGDDNGSTSFPGPVSCTSARVQSLARFQTHILRHALRLPGLQRLVYSTCSVYRQENEDVVAAVLPDARRAGFELQRALPQWPRRGLRGTHDWADCVARVHPDLDGTDGFFVALFVRQARPTK